MKKNTIKKKKIKRDCWNLNLAFLTWLKERLPVYLKEAGRVVNLEFHKFDIDGVEMTQLECIKEMISLVNWLTAPGVDDWSDEYYEKIRRLLLIWSEVFMSMWW